MPGSQVAARLRPHVGALLPGLLVVGLMLVWAVHDGGYDEDTWYWGALAMLALATGTVLALDRRSLRLSRPAALAIGLFAAYVAWSYLSISWAQYPGAALTGANKALLYLLVFALLSVLPWTARGALVALLTFGIGVGAIAIVLLTRLAVGAHVSVLFVGGRLAAPTGYINSTAALFTMAALVAVGLATRRELWGPVRGALLACAAAELDLAITVQSRGWLFTLPLVVALVVLVSPNRLRLSAAALAPVIAAALSARPLLRVLEDTSSGSLQRLAMHAGRPALLLCCGVFVVGTLGAWADQVRPISLGTTARRLVGTALIAAALGGTAAVGLVVSNGHVGSFISHQWNGFAHEETNYSGSHFANVGSGRYDFWRVALGAFEAHPVGGLGQDNFGDYYLLHRHTTEEPTSPHSLEMRLLAETGIVGFVLFAGAIGCALVAAARARRHGPELNRAMAAVAVLPVIVWLVHGSVDWFWEMPALSGPALGFLAISGSLGRRSRSGRASAAAPPRRIRSGALRLSAGLLGAAALVAAAAVVGLPYLSVREVSIATDIQNTDPTASLNDLHTAGRLNPLDSTPGLVAGAVALRHGDLARARAGLRQSIAREPGDWLAWLLAGVAASQQGDRSLARADYLRAHAIDRTQPVVAEALRRIGSRDPLTAAEAFRLLVPVS